MVYGKHPFEKDGHVTRDRVLGEDVKFTHKNLVTEELKEVIAGMLTKSPSKRSTITELMAMDWFKVTDSELKDSVQELVDEENKQIERQEYLQRKAALKGNKFINDEGKVVVMNRNLNCDIREDLL